jgi:RNA polymerase sigma-70 factor (ECF subfamily)
MSALSEGHRLVLVLSVLLGLTYEEIARVMEIPQGTVKSRAFHAIRKLRAQLTDVAKPK